MPSLQCDSMDDIIGQDHQNDDPRTPEPKWTRDASRRDSLAISHIDREGSEVVAVETTSAADIVKYHDQEIQCDFDEKGKKTVQSPPAGSLPTRSRLAILMVCTCMAVFLQALVSRCGIASENRVLNLFAGHDHHRYSHPSHHPRISLHRRRRLVWVGVFLDQLRFSTTVGSHLYLLRT